MVRTRRSEVASMKHPTANGVPPQQVFFAFARPQAMLLLGGPEDRLPAVAGSETSREAARKARRRVSFIRSRVIECFESAGAAGLSDEELFDTSGIAPNSARSRRIELTCAGLLRDSGRRRKTASGATAVVWVAEAAR